MNSTKISLWCADNPDAWVEMYFTDIGIELEMQLNLGSQIKRTISYTELNSSQFDIICLNLDEMLINLRD